MPSFHKFCMSFAAAAGLITGLSTEPVGAQAMGQGGQQAMFKTKAEAEAAAKKFNCKGAHKMGDLWMPCASHGEASGGHSSPAAH